MENMLHAIYILSGMGAILGVILALNAKKTSTGNPKKMSETPTASPVEDSSVKRIARVKCSGTSQAVRTKFNYEGISDCVAASKLIGGNKLCPYACLGLGTCISTCQFGAISLKDGIAHIDSKKCQACGKCVEICPKKVIVMHYDTRTPWVKCNSRNQGTIVQQICDIGCISCRNCETACGFDAIKIENDLAQIDQTKCRNCVACMAKCPRRVIAT